MRRRTSATVARLGVLIAIAFVLSWLELLIPLPVRIPGVKLGLCHIVVLYALYRLGWREAVTISCVRVLLSTILFGSIPTLAFSLCGSGCGLAIMLWLRRTNHFSLLSVSIAGSVCYNLGQLVCAVLLTGTAKLGWYLAILFVSGCVAGTAVGAVATLVVMTVNPKK